MIVNNFKNYTIFNLRHSIEIPASVGKELEMMIFEWKVPLKKGGGMQFYLFNCQLQIA